MTHEPHHDLAPGESGQGRFIGYFALGLLALMAIFTIGVLIGAARTGVA